MRQKHKASGDYKVGYCKPPKEHQFKAGAVRARRSANQPKTIVEIFKEVVEERVKIRIGDEVRTMTRGQAVLFANHQKALKSDQKAMHNFFLVAEEGQLFQEYQDPTRRNAGLHVPRMTLEQLEHARHGDNPEGAPVWKSVNGTMRLTAGSGFKEYKARYDKIKAERDQERQKLKSKQ
jgi:hypothetical protein